MSDSLANALRGNSVLDRIANPVVANPLAGIAAASQAAESTWRNRLSQAEQAAGQVFQASINPDGTPNQAALMTGLKQAGPVAALAAQAAAQRGQNLDADTLKTNLARASYAASQGMGVLANNGGLAPLDAVQKMFDDELRQGTITQQQHDAYLAEFTDDPVKNAQILLRRGAQNMDAQLQLHLAYGKPGTATGPGGVEIGTMQSQTTGALTSPQQPGMQGQGVQTGLTPEQASGRVVVGYQSNGQPIYGPAEQVAPSRYTGGPGGPSGGPSPVGPGRLPPALQGPGGGQGGGAKAPATTTTTPAPAGGGDPTRVAAPDPRIVADNEANQKAFIADQQARPTQERGIQSLINAQHALELTTTGSKTDIVHNIKSFLVAQGVLPASVAESVENYDYFVKSALDYARQQAASSGTGTNLQLEAAEHSNANPAMVNAANRKVIQTNIGRERQNIAATMLSPDQKLGSGHINWKAKFAQDTDPRGFAVDRMRPDEITTMVDGMTKDEKTKFYKSVAIAKRLNLINPPQQ